jgi:hypothetical protein
MLRNAQERKTALELEDRLVLEQRSRGIDLWTSEGATVGHTTRLAAQGARKRLAAFARPDIRYIDIDLSISHTHKE